MKIYLMTAVSIMCLIVGISPQLISQIRILFIVIGIVIIANLVEMFWKEIQSLKGKE